MSAIFGLTFCPVGAQKFSLHIYIYIYMELTDANTVVTSQHVSQSYFINEIENGRSVFYLYNLMQTLERVWSNLKVLM